jgi:hypothetical protein
MARKTLSTRGRVVAAGVTVAVGSALAGFMAAGDHTADATQTVTTPAAASDGSAGASATPYDGTTNGNTDGSTNGGFPTGNSGFSPQPQTRTGGS